MTLLFQNTAEGGTSGTAVTSGNSGGASGNALSVNVGTGNVITYASDQKAHGALAYKLVLGTTASSFIQGSAAGPGRFVTEFSVRLSAVPSATSYLGSIRNATANMCVLTLSSTGALQVQNAAGAGISGSASPTPLAVDTWYRIAVAVTPGVDTATGRIEYALYAGDSTTPIHTWSSSAVNTGTTEAASVRFGSTTTPPLAYTLWYDDLRAGNLASGYFGPFGSPPPDAVGASTSPVAYIDASASTAGAGALTYSIVQLSGATGAATSVGTGRWVVPVPAEDTATYRVTVEQTDGQKDTLELSINPVATASSLFYTPDGATWLPI